MSVARRAAVALVVVACAGGAFLAHRALSRADTTGPAALVALVPVAVVLVGVARRMRHPLLLAAALALAIFAGWWYWSEVERHLADLFFIEHAGFMGGLAILFGRTLRPGAEPLCSRFARIVHGTIDQRVAAYTRGLTLTWAAFFAMMCAASCLLYLTGHHDAWLVLANMLTPILIPLLFVGEYGVRRWALPHHESGGILVGVRAFRRHMAGSQAPR